MHSDSQDKEQIRQLRARGQRLKPVVTIAGRGLSDGVIAEVDRALTDHELIKVRLTAGDRDERRALLDSLCERCDARLIQAIGAIGLLLRRSDRPDPKLSNLLRAR